MSKVHCGAYFNKGNGLCGLSEYGYKTSWHIKNVTCLRCLKCYISQEDINPFFTDKAKEVYKKVKYNNEFDDLIED